MRGYPWFNFPAFDAMRDWLVLQGYQVVSPADLDRANGFDAASMPEDWDWHQLPPHLNVREIVQRDLAAIQMCDGIALLKGWRKSTGACAELAVAQWLGLSVIEDADVMHCPTHWQTHTWAESRGA